MKYSDGPVFEAISTSIPKADAENEEVVDALKRILSTIPMHGSSNIKLYKTNDVLRNDYIRKIR